MGGADGQSTSRIAVVGENAMALALASRGEVSKAQSTTDSEIGHG